MRSFFKIFFASLLALIAFVLIIFFFTLGYIGSVASAQHDDVGSNGVLVLDLSQAFGEKGIEDPLANFSDTRYNTPGVYDVLRLIRYAKSDSSIRGIFIKAGSNANGFGTTEEIRDALIDFKQSRKFIYAYGDVIPLKAYYGANVADRIYCNPKGGLEWRGLTSVMGFVKGSLDKLEIQPEIFYAGKFKSATEPLRAIKMTDANRVQVTELLGGIFNHILDQTAAVRNQDTAVLRRCVDQQLIRHASDAIEYKLLDGAKYNDEVLQEIVPKVKVRTISDINFVPLGKYLEAVKMKMKANGRDRIALIYAEGNIVSGKNDQREIGEVAYRDMIRKARLDKDIRAIVLRINSGGGSALVSENLWRELSLAKAAKPVVISFGDVAASGGYYLSCNADRIFADPMTITGSIGVFSIIFNTQSFFKNKLGVTFDAVQTAKQPDAISMVQPLTDLQKRYMQNDVDSIYYDFKSRVADGRKKDINYIDSIAQGRVWGGSEALKLGLVDEIGGIQAAVNYAAKLAKTSDYRLREYPEPKNFLELLLNNYKETIKMKSIREDLGMEGLKWYKTMSSLQSMAGVPQMKLPFELNIP
ncbi:MAG: signal peptide peptidase SppA [Bacteroidota bacterium]|nr:signal peptide peptidase SppA [Bacteroidota bacterium]MDP4249535.1 signal peptide peptidase SppA [Bacteroidota bacterium]